MRGIKKFFSFIGLTAILTLNFSIISAINFYKDNLNCDSVYMVNFNSGMPVVEKNISKRRSPASLTKIMTFIVAYENSQNRNDTKVLITKEILDNVDPESSGSKLKEGESISITDLLHCMMISSSGYCAQALANYIGGGDTQKFVSMMNEKALSLECENTHFENPDGIYNENQYTTAADMYKITKYAMSNPEFLNIVSKSEYTMFGDERDPVITTNHMIDKKRGGKYYCPWVKGIKTGYVNEAGRCLVSYASKDGKTYVTVAMGGPTKDSEGNTISDNMAMIDTLSLYNWAYENLKNITVCARYEPLVQTGLKFVWGKDNIFLSSNQDVNIIVPKEASRDNISLKYNVPEEIESPVKKDDLLGDAEISYEGEKIKSIPLCSSQDFKKSYLLVAFDFLRKVFTSKIFIFSICAFSAILILYILYVIKYNMKMKRKNKIIKLSKFKK